MIYNRQSAEESAVATRALMEFPVFNQNIVLEQTNIPTLIVNGIYDPLITQEMKHKYDQVFHNLEMVEFNQSGHAPHIEEPNHFLEVFLGFVKQMNIQNADIDEAMRCLFLISNDKYLAPKSPIHSII